LGEIPNAWREHFANMPGQSPRMADFRRFRELARLLHQVWHRRMGRRVSAKGECKVSNVSNLMKHALAALAAMFITGTLMINGLAQSQPEVHSVAGILA
jgi:hypothetical protein